LEKRIMKAFDFRWEGVVERPDGYYWQSHDGREYGPYASCREAHAAALPDDDAEFAWRPDTGADEALAEIGASDWIDPDTGELAEDNATRTALH
jgi:hypothetical protein